MTPPDPRVQAKVPAIYIWPRDGQENRSSELGGTIPRNTGPNTASGTKGLLHQMDVYVTWFSSNSGRQQDPVFPAIVDTVMLALRYSQPNPAQLTDPATNLTSTVYNVGESMRYRTGVEATADERWLRYDSLIQVSVLGNHQRLRSVSAGPHGRRIAYCGNVPHPVLPEPPDIARSTRCRPASLGLMRDNQAVDRRLIASSWPST